nr:sensor histidine kinase [Desulfobulbaceae bacterium]
MKKFAFLALILVVIGIGVLHFVTPGYLVFYHDTYRRLSYFPIVLGALWFGVRGGLTLALLSSFAFIPHLLLYIGKGPELYLGELMEVVLYIAAGTVTGFIAGREARLRERYKAVAQKLEKSYEKLHEETELLIEAEQQLSASQRLSYLGQLSASLAHEIKNPLSSIRGTAEIFLDEFPEGHPKREFVTILLKETDRLNSTVEEVLNYSKGQRQPDNFVKEPLSRVIDQVLKLLENHLRKKSIIIDVTGREDAEEFLVAGAKISQVFLNIILNAIDAISDSGLISVSLIKQADGGIKAVICDTGSGIPTERLDSVFTPFVTGKEGGTGLGLSISRKIIESYGGSIECRNNDDVGACFTLYLPPQIMPEERV